MAQIHGAPICSDFGGWHLSGEIFPLKAQCHIYQGNHHRHFHQRSDHRREGRARVDAEHRDRNRNRQFKVIRSSSERQSRVLE